MAEIVIIFDIKGQTIQANQAAIEALGINPVGMSPQELIDLFTIKMAVGSPGIVKDLPSSQAQEGDMGINGRLILIDQQGKEHFFQVSATPLSVERGISRGAGAWHNGSTREHLLEQLEVEQSRLETIIENAPEAILVVNEDGQLVLANPAAERILVRQLPFGMDYEHFSSLQLSYTDGTPYDPRYIPLICSALDGTRHNNIEILIQMPDGQPKHILASTSPIIDRKGNLNGAVGILQDITLRKRAEEELRIQAGRSQMLASLSQAFAEAGLDHSDLLETIVREIGGISRDICAIQLVSENGARSTLSSFFHPDPQVRQAVQEAAHERSFRIPEEERNSNQVIRMTNASPEDMHRLLPSSYKMLLDYFPIYNGLIVPLRAHGRWIGSLGLLRSEVKQHFNMEDQFFYQDLADRAALAIEDAMLFEQQALRVRELHALNLATKALLATLDLETLLVEILEAAQQAIPAAEQAALYLLNPDTGSLQIRASAGFLGDPQQVKNEKLNEYLSTAVKEQQPLLIHNIPKKATGALGKSAADPPIRSAVIAPLVLSNKILGVLSLTGSKPHLFTESDLRLLTSFAATATAALNNVTLYAEVQRLAITDPLTHQFNRNRFFEMGEMEIHRFRRFKNPLSAIMLDLDHFKEINDTYGHGAGDQVLASTARRVRTSIRVVDILSRYGGDEFAILLPDATLLEALDIAERIRASIAGEEFQTSEGLIKVSISLGIAQANGENESLSGLLGRADTALYTAKERGRNQAAF